MVTYYISQDCVAAILEGDEELDIRGAVSACLSSAGLPPWRDMETELYSHDGRKLLIARPCPPARQRLFGAFPRLRRK